MGRARAALVVLACTLLAACQAAPRVTAALEKLGFPVEPSAVRFAVIGDSGTGASPQYDLGQRMAEYRQDFPFDFVLMLGDNLYGGSGPADYDRKFKWPYKSLLDAKVEFYAALGNHDNTNERFFAPFHMSGSRYYAFTKGNARFFALDSNYLDTAQLQWLETELHATNTDWKICYMHHPIYSASSYHGVDPELRLVLEPLLLKYGVDVVFSGHEHFYERLKPQEGIAYFTSGSAGKLHLRGSGHPEMAAAGFDQDLHFMLIEIVHDELVYRAIARTGKVVDSGVVLRRAHEAANAGPTPTPGSQASRLLDTFGELAAN